jgi:hypothetical protein
MSYNTKAKKQAGKLTLLKIMGLIILAGIMLTVAAHYFIH